MKKHFIIAVIFTELFSSALFSHVAHSSISLIGFTETKQNFTATYFFANNENLFPSTINTTGLYWKGGLIETFSPENLVAPASYTLTWTAWQIASSHPGESPTGPMGVDFCTFNATFSTAQPCNQSATLLHPISVMDGTLHNDTFNFKLNRNNNGSGTITVTGNHVSAVALPSSVALPSAVWLLGSGVLGLLALAQKRRLRSPLPGS